VLLQLQCRYHLTVDSVTVDCVTFGYLVTLVVLYVALLSLLAYHSLLLLTHLTVDAALAYHIQSYSWSDRRKLWLQADVLAIVLSMYIYKQLQLFVSLVLNHTGFTILK
jgi:hypothetical protein